MRNLYILVAVLFFSLGSMAQELSLSIEKKNSAEFKKGDKVVIGVFATTQTKPIGGFQLYIQYDNEILSYSDVLNKHSAFSKEWVSNDNTRFFSANWLTLDPKGLTFKKGDKLFDLEFTYLGGETDLIWQTKQKIDNGSLVQGETMFIDTQAGIITLELINGCFCNNK
ncbi:MAG: hypothetical protein K9G76_13070 [Bacteroidales bacterium]|nr:hypothetical protein [Bacteroidales bacterium]MCF8406180.1 hypothetical protein [Bacteroidales bacterium]